MPGVVTGGPAQATTDQPQPQLDADGNPIPEEEKKTNIPPETFEDMKNIWSVFDLDGSGQVPTFELRTILRALDIDPSWEELEYISKLIDPSKAGYFTFEDLHEVMEEKLKDTDTLEDLVEQLKKLDKDQDGRIPNPQFK